MLFHVSIEADDPRQAASALAEIWGGVALPFPPVGEDSWCALAEDGLGSMIEVYARGTEVHLTGEGTLGLAGSKRRHGPTHLAMSTALNSDEVLSIAARNGWKARYCRREDRVGLIEIWVDGCLLVEVLTPEMQREYLDTFAPGNWRRMLAEGFAKRAA